MRCYVFVSEYFSSVVVCERCITDPPDAPLNPEIKEIFSNHCLLSWQPPSNDGGSPVTGYYVERCMATSARWMPVNKEPITTLETTINDLIEDNEYEFRVCAENKIGRGPPSEPTKPVVARDPWSEYSQLYLKCQ